MSKKFKQTNLRTCSYKSSNLFLGSLSWATWGNIASHLPLLISATNVSILSTVLRETWHSFCNVWNVWCNEFSLQNWSTILITLRVQFIRIQPKKEKKGIPEKKIEGNVIKQKREANPSECKVQMKYYLEGNFTLELQFLKSSFALRSSEKARSD